MTGKWTRPVCRPELQGKRNCWRGHKHSRDYTGVSSAPQSPRVWHRGRSARWKEGTLSVPCTPKPTPSQRRDRGNYGTGAPKSTPDLSKISNMSSSFFTPKALPCISGAKRPLYQSVSESSLTPESNPNREDGESYTKSAHEPQKILCLLSEIQKMNITFLLRKPSLRTCGPRQIHQSRWMPSALLCARHSGQMTITGTDTFAMSKGNTDLNNHWNLLN